MSRAVASSGVAALRVPVAVPLGAIVVLSAALQISFGRTIGVPGSSRTS